MINKIPKGFLTTRQVLEKANISMPLFRKMVYRGAIPDWLRLKNNLGRRGGVHNYWSDNIFWYINFFTKMRKKGKSITKIVKLLPDNVTKKHRDYTEKVAEDEVRYHKLLVASERKERGVSEGAGAIVVEAVMPLRGGKKEIVEVVFLGDEIDRVKKVLRAVPVTTAAVVYSE